MVIPRSRSSAMESSTCACISRSASPPHSWISRSARVDLPWSTCAMMEKLRSCRMKPEGSCRELPRQGSSGRADYRENRGLTAAGCDLGRQRGARARLKQPFELVPVEAVAAHHRAVQQQHRDLEAVAPQQLRVRIHVQHLNRRQRALTGEPAELGEHLLAELAVVPVHDGEARGRHRLQRPRAPRGAGPWAFTWVAMNCTVAGGTSPTAVIL